MQMWGGDKHKPSRYLTSLKLKYKIAKNQPGTKNLTTLYKTRQNIAIVLLKINYFYCFQNQVAANANFCGTNNSGAMGGAANNSGAAAGNNGGGGGGMFSSFFSGATSSGGFASQQYGGFSSQDGGKLAASEMGVGAGGAGGGLVERAMRDFNVWMPQSM